MFQVTEILHGEDGKTCGAMCRDSNTGEIFQVRVFKCFVRVFVSSVKLRPSFTHLTVVN